MIALDTNVLARLLLQDDAAQHARAKALFKTKQVFTAPVTVMLELVWVLQSQDIEAQQIALGITALLNLPNFKPDCAQALRTALDHYLQGMDFADALHLALSAGESKFLSFDKSFARQANKNSLLPELVLI